MTRVFIEKYQHKRGGHCSSTAMRDLLEFYGHSFTEEMVFGLGCGIDFIYIKNKKIMPPVYIGGRVYDLEGNLCRNLGIEMEVISGLPYPDAWLEVKKMLDSEIPAVVLADVYFLDYLRAKVHFSSHRIVLVGYDDEKEIVYVADNDRDSIQECSFENLRKARNSSFFPGPASNTFYRFSVPEKLMALKDAIPKALFWTASNYLDESPSTTKANMDEVEISRAIVGLEKLAREMGNWKKEFDSQTITQILRNIYVSAEKGGTGYGGNFRRIYGRFLKECSRILGESSLDSLGSEFVEIGNIWSEMCLTFKSLSQDGSNAIEMGERMILDIYEKEREAFLKLKESASRISG
ncbi:MAG: BtrH N-terminal domain-containing protein [Actinomycetota bacterium]|nr:BtrH N-terminal domain-containing protein [Actinomycetota bacterium]